MSVESVSQPGLGSVLRAGGSLRGRKAAHVTAQPVAGATRLFWGPNTRFGARFPGRTTVVITILTVAYSCVMWSKKRAQKKTDNSQGWEHRVRVCLTKWQAGVSTEEQGEQSKFIRDICTGSK